jgi:hypothetical protein
VARRNGASPPPYADASLAFLRKDVAPAGFYHFLVFLPMSRAHPSLSSPSSRWQKCDLTHLHPGDKWIIMPM